MVRKALPVALVLAGLLLASSAPGAGRSIVGRKLPAVRFTDTEGHSFAPADFEGSVLVMFAGVPW